MDCISGCSCANQVMPVFIINQVDIREIEGLDLVADIADTENTLLAIHALAEAKQLAAQVQGKLGGVGVKGGLLAANFQQLFKAVKTCDSLLSGFDSLPVPDNPLVTINGAVVSGVFPLVIISGTYQAVNMMAGTPSGQA